MGNVISAIVASLTTATALAAAMAWFGSKAVEIVVAKLNSELEISEFTRKNLIKSSLDFRSQQLIEFYWPIYSRLQKDNAIWKRILDKRSSDENLKMVAREIELKEVLPNHTEIVQIIQTKIHLAQASPELQEVLMQYIRHVAVYKAMRAAGDEERFPISLGEVWPEDLFSLVEVKTRKLQSDFDLILSQTLKKTD